MLDEFLHPPRGVDPWRRSSRQETRILRDRMAAHEAAMDRAASESPAFTSARMLVQVYNGGSMASSAEKVYFTHPVLVTGAETEGAAGILSTDTDTTVPVVVLQHAPSVNDYLTAYSVGGRWVSERGGSSGGGGTLCSPCTIPNEDLTLSWTNILTGNGSATMTFGAGPSWITGCVDSGLQFALSCNSGSIELRAIFFVSGSCPTGSSNYCSNLRSNPLKLTLSDSTCSPFSLTFTLDETQCPELADEGNTQFTISL